jgi:hypothetical protein
VAPARRTTAEYADLLEQHLAAVRIGQVFDAALLEIFDTGLTKLVTYRLSSARVTTLRISTDQASGQVLQELVRTYRTSRSRSRRGTEGGRGSYGGRVAGPRTVTRTRFRMNRAMDPASHGQHCHAGKCRWRTRISSA